MKLASPDQCVVQALPLCQVCARLKRRGLPMKVAKGNTIYFPDQPARYIYQLCDGMAGLFHVSSKGDENIVVFIVPGSVFGLGSLLDPNWQAYPFYCKQEPEVSYYHARAVTNAVVCKIASDELQEALRSDGNLAVSFLKVVVDRCRSSGRMTSFPGRRDAEKRLVALLVLLGEKIGRPSEHGLVLDIKLSHQDLADVLSATRPTITRELAELRRMGLVEIEDRHIRLPDPLALAALLE